MKLTRRPRTIVGLAILLASCMSLPPMPGPPVTSADHTLTARIEVAAPISAVYRAFTEGPDLVRWSADRATARGFEGTELWLGFVQPDGESVAARGLFLALFPNQRVVFRMVYPPEFVQSRGVDLETFVVHETTVSMEETTGGRVAVSVEDQIDSWTPRAYVGAFSEVWSAALLNLKSVLEGGPDLRKRERSPSYEFDRDPLP